MRRFLPWVGSTYARGIASPMRIMILGESHYIGDRIEPPSFTIDVVRDLAQRRHHRFFTAVQRLLTGVEGAIPQTSRAAFWEGVAFYNFIQAPVGDTPAIRPTRQMWADAVLPFQETLHELSPEFLLVLGVELARHLPPIDPSIAVVRLPHPASRRFSWRHWRPIVADALSPRRA